MKFHENTEKNDTLHKVQYNQCNIIILARTCMLIHTHFFTGVRVRDPCNGYRSIVPPSSNAPPPSPVVFRAKYFCYRCLRCLETKKKGVCRKFALSLVVSYKKAFLLVCMAVRHHKRPASWPLVRRVPDDVTTVCYCVIGVHTFA